MATFGGPALEAIASAAGLESIDKAKAFLREFFYFLDYDVDTSMANIENRLQMLMLNSQPV